MNLRSGTSSSATNASDFAPTISAAVIDAKAARERRARLAILLMWFLATGLVALMASNAMGQAPFKVLPVNPAIEDPATFKKMESAAKAVSQTQDLASVGAANGRMARFYFMNYVPAKITQPDAVTQISSLMENVRDRISSAERSNKPGAGPMKQWTYQGLKPVAQGNYQPAARINAILFISRLDTTPADRRALKPPVPLSLIPADFIPIYQDKTAPDGVRAAALQGLHRYVSYAAPVLRDPLRSTLITEMQQLLDAEPPEGRTEAVHAYLQRFAVDILASLRGATDADLGKKLVSISTETKRHDLIALHSAKRLGTMSADLRGNVGPTSKVLDQWTVRAMRSYQYEIARLNSRERPKPVPGQPTAADAMVTTKKDETKKPSPSMMGGGYDEMGGMESDMMDDGGYGMEEMGGMDDGMYEMEGMGMGMGYGMTGVVQANPQPPEVLVSRRKLNFVLQQLHQGVTGSGKAGEPRTAGGLLGAVEDDQKQIIQNWLTAMQGVVDALNEPTLDTLDKWVEALDEQVAMLEEIAGPEAVALSAQEPIQIPGVSRIVATTPVEKAEVPDAPVLDKAGAPQFPENLDELAAPE